MKNLQPVDTSLGERCDLGKGLGVFDDLMNSSILGDGYWSGIGKLWFRIKADLVPSNREMISHRGLGYERGREQVLGGNEEANPVPKLRDAEQSPDLGGLHVGVVDVSAALVVQSERSKERKGERK